MKKLFPIFILLFAFGVSAQVKKQTVKPSTKPTQKVVVEKLNGERLTGLFVGANAETVTIRISETNLFVEFSEIKAVWFGAMPSWPDTEHKPEKENEFVTQALRSLRKLVSATGSGIDYAEYDKRVIDANAEIGELLIKIPEGFVKTEIKASLEAFTEARDAWSWGITNRSGNMLPDSEPAKSLQKKYNVPTYQADGVHLMEVGKLVNAAWAAANQHFQKADGAKPD
jgi:hypothetical protein